MTRNTTVKQMEAELNKLRANYGPAIGRAFDEIHGTGRHVDILNRQVTDQGKDIDVLAKVSQKHGEALKHLATPARPTWWAWLLAVLTGFIAWWAWAAIDFTQTLASGDVVNHIADRWWVAALVGFAAAVIVIAAIPWRRHTAETEAEEASVPTQQIDTTAVVSKRRSTHV